MGKTNEGGIGQYFMQEHDQHQKHQGRYQVKHIMTSMIMESAAQHGVILHNPQLETVHPHNVYFRQL